MNRKISSIFSLFIALSLAFCLSSCALVSDIDSFVKKPEDKFSGLQGPYDVLRVVDGDTIEIQLEDQEVTIRLIGIDAPESVHPDQDKNTEEGQIASDYLKSLLDGKSVLLEYDEEKTDKYQRTLAYVFISDEMVMAEDYMLQEGYAKVLNIDPNNKYLKHFLSIEKQAKKDQKGFWTTGIFDN